MCVIVYKPKGQIFTDEDFHKCWDRNGHGLGFISTNPFVFEKGLMTEKRARKTTKKFRGLDYESVFHFRIQSKGGVSCKLTHPFDFSGETGRKRFLFHNGTIHLLNPDADASDTSQAAQWLSVLDDDDARSLLVTWKEFGRFVTCIENPNNKKIEVQIFPDKESVWINGCWFSNSRHLITGVAKAMVGDGMEHWHYC